MARSRFAWTAPLLGLTVGLISGLADAIVLARDAERARSIGPGGYMAVVWTFATIGCLAGLTFASRRLAVVRAAALALLPALVLLSRGASVAKRTWGLSGQQVVLGWTLVVLALTMFLLLPRLEPTRRWGRWLAAAAISGIGLLVAARDVRPRDWLTGKPVLASEADDVRRNVVLVFVDTVRYDAVFGPRAAAPHLARFAQESISFESAWAPGSWTMPSHAAVLTGVDPWQLDTKAESYAAVVQPLATRFRARGYNTAAVLANSLLHARLGMTQGFDEFTISRSSGVCRSALGNLASRLYLHDGPRAPLCAWMSATEVTRRSVEFIRRTTRPYLLVVNYFDAHDPYYVPKECRDAGVPLVARAVREPVVRATSEHPAKPEAIERVHEQYRAAVRCMDRSLDRLLREATRDQNTVVAVVSDHGEQFGEHRLGWHGNSVYRPLIHVPLILRIPGLRPERVAAPVSITDLYDTLVRAAEPRRARAPLPLLDALQRRPALSWYENREDATVEGAFSVVRDDVHLIRWNDGREALFDQRADPDEVVPIDPLERRELTDPLRTMVLEAARSRTNSHEFNALGYLQ